MGKNLRRRVVYKRILNFHKDNWKEILSALFMNFAYAFCSMTAFSLLALRHHPSTAIALTIYYPLLSEFVKTPEYKTRYGKITSKMCLIIGGFLGYLLSPDVAGFVQLILDLNNNL